MTVLSESPNAPEALPPAPARNRRHRAGRGRIAFSLVLQLVAMAGIGLLVYPDAANWFAALGHNAEISGYVERVDQTADTERQRILDAAYAYNDQLQPGPLTDPYISQDDDAKLRSDLYLSYEQLLRVSGSDAIGTLSYPKLGIGLPIYHGTTEHSLSRGVGHLYGTSMPVGGPSTHSVLTSHSGLPQAQLFTNLLHAEVGDTFWISVLGEDHYYRVESTETVLPGETDSLKIVEGQDWVTLFTCAPIGINSHRFMVHAVRIADPAPGDDTQVLAGDGVQAGFPWWALWFVAGSAACAWLLFAPPRRKRRN